MDDSDRETHEMKVQEFQENNSKVQEFLTDMKNDVENNNIDVNSKPIILMVM